MSRTTSRRSRRRLAAAVASVATVGSAALAATPTAPPPHEYEVKAAFLYHFAHLVDWPAPDVAGAPFVIAVVGSDPFGATLADVLAGKSVRGQPVRVQRYPGSAQVGEERIHILFVGGGGDERVRRALAAVGGRPVLTVGEGPRFAERGGMIGFRVTPEGRVAFDINLRRAEQSGLRIRAQLLKLARIVGQDA